MDDGDGLQLSRSTSATRFNDSLISSLHYNVLRIPGGYLTRWFNWEKAAGKQYGTDRNYAGNVEQVKSGLQEMKLFADKHSMKVMYTLTVADPPEKIRRLINTWNELEPKDRVPIEWFELGNEDYDKDSSVNAAVKYARTVVPLISVIREMSPKAKIGAIVANPIAAAWDTTVFQSLHRSIDYIIWHRYVPYSDYYETHSFERTIEAFGQMQSEVSTLNAMMFRHPLPVYLTEYNLSYYSAEKQHQNIVLEPRYILLLGNFITFAYQNNIAGLVKHCLASIGYHTFADINFTGKDTGTLSISGTVAKNMNRWMSEQDSVAVKTYEPSHSPWEFSVLLGKGPLGRSCIIQNHTARSITVRFTGIGKSVSTGISYFQHGSTMWTDRRKNIPLSGEVRIEPHSLNFYSIQH